jgi:hypothetical protein
VVPSALSDAVSWNSGGELRCILYLLPRLPRIHSCCARQLPQAFACLPFAGHMAISLSLARLWVSKRPAATGCAAFSPAACAAGGAKSCAHQLGVAFCAPFAYCYGTAWLKDGVYGYSMAATTFAFSVRARRTQTRLRVKTAGLSWDAAAHSGAAFFSAPHHGRQHPTYGRLARCGAGGAIPLRLRRIAAWVALTLRFGAGSPASDLSFLRCPATTYSHLLEPCRLLPDA